MIKIAVPDNDYFKILTENLKEVSAQYDLELIIAKENKIDELLINEEADIALMNPLNYGKLLLNGEYGLIPTTCISALGYSDLIKIYFGQNLKSITKLGIGNEEPFLELIAKIILMEKYNFDVTVSRFTGNKEDALKQYDAILTYDKIENYSSSLDLSEEWTDTFEYELPFGFWVSRVSENAEKYAEITRAIAAKNLPNAQSMHEDIRKAETNYEREGEIKYLFDNKTEDAIDNILEILYQLGYLEEMTDSKISENN